MRWQGARRSTNVEDRRGRRRGPGKRGAAAGGGAVVILALIALVLGADPAEVIQIAEQAQLQAPSPGGGYDSVPAGNEELVDFVRLVLADTEDTWTTVFAQNRRRYLAPTLVLFSDHVSSACGGATSAVRPFYCPGDRQVYLDLTFFRDLDRRFGAPGDFAQAYVIAHEVGHHVQDLLGVSEQMRQLGGRGSTAQRNALSVRQELQADCYAGVWAHHAAVQRNRLETGGIEEGLAAATAIGDDTLQRRGGRHVQPESWTHGSSDQRVRWFRRGLETGDAAECDTFSARQL